MTMPPAPSLDLRIRSHQAMVDEGFQPDVPQPVTRSLEDLDEYQVLHAAGDIQDLRTLPWSSIDNESSQDLDQIEFAESLPDGSVRILVGIADVDSFAPRGSAIDDYAAQNTTSVYTGVETFPMLPVQLSTALTSLLPDQDRLAVVMEMIVNGEGEVTKSTAYPARVRNRAKLTYAGVGEWLEGGGVIPKGIQRIPGLEDQIRLQDRAAKLIHGQRLRAGALDFETIEASPVVANGQVVDLTVQHKNRARYLIEDFMIAANSAMAKLLEGRGIASIQRVVRTPERWDRIRAVAESLGSSLPEKPDSQALATFLSQRKASDPEHYPDLSLSIVKLLGPGEYTVVQGPGDQQGHFGLAVHNYTHSTAPNRRYADLITQRILKAALSGKPPPYSVPELESIAARCTERENAARKVERLMRKVAAAILFGRHIGQVYDAIVTGVKSKGAFVRTLKPPVEGRVVRGDRGLDVGDRIRVKLIATEPEKGFIDFEKVDR